MTDHCAFSQEEGMHRFCGLLGAKEFGDPAPGRIAALREIVEHFQIEWEITAQSSERREDARQGFTLEMRGQHGLGGHSIGQPCSHCANLMLSLRIVEEWLLPRGGQCEFCSTEASSTFVRGDRNAQREASSTRTVRMSSGPGTSCQLAQCHEFCMQEIRERLAALGAAERRSESGRMVEP